MNEVLGLLHLTSHLDKTISFFIEVLNFEEIDRSECQSDIFERLFHVPQGKCTLTKLRLGQAFHYLIEIPYAKAPHYPKESKSNDLWFQHIAIVTPDMEKAYTQLMKYHITPISESPQTLPDWNKAAAGIKAFYFQSPDGYPLELIYFPPGKGNPVWQKSTSLFLGVDHTAISVSNTENSFKFYQELLHMQEVGGSLNFGETQEKLSGVIGAKVKITSLAFPHSQRMGIEFLEYLNPLNGRKIENSVTPMATVIKVDSLPKQINTMRINGQSQPCTLIFDPDGHALLLVENL